MPKIRRRQRCPQCGSLNIIRWGLREGRQRYRCQDCGSSFVKHKEGVSKSNRLVWFRKWILGKQGIEDIAHDSGYSARQLHRWFGDYLDACPTWTIKTSEPIYLLIDGTYYSNAHCLIVYRAENLRRTLFYRFTTLEDDDEVASDLLNIRSMGFTVAGITTDGGDNIIRAIEYVYPNVPRQRCVVHVQRECLRWITLHPRSPEARTLRGIVQQLSDVSSVNDKLWWIKTYEHWVEENAEYACEKAINPNTGQSYFVRDNLRKAYIHLKRALPKLFTYIDCPGVPKTTNSIEAFFGHIKDHLRLHRGLSETRVDNFIKWYLFFNDEKKRK